MKLAVINTGGTIGSIGSPLAPMGNEQFHQAFTKVLSPIIEAKYPDLELSFLTDIKFPATGLDTIDSTNLQPQDWCVVAQKILENYNHYDGWLVLHGTDSMAYTASALPFLLSSVNRLGVPTASLTKPVVLTGSQLPLFSQDSPENPLTLRYSTDAFQNVCAAIDFLHLQIPEVAVAFDNTLLRGNRTVKINANMDTAFGSPNMAPLAEMGTDLTVDRSLTLTGAHNFNVSLDNPEVLSRALERLDYITEKIRTVNIIPLLSFPSNFGQDKPSILSKLIDATVDSGANGIVLESYGEGNFPSGELPSNPKGCIQTALKRASEKGLHIIDCTQVWVGHVNFSVYAAGAWLSEIGAISGNDLTAIAALAKMAVLVAEQDYKENNWSQEDVDYLSGTDLFGEMTQSDRLQVGTHDQLGPNETLQAFDRSAVLFNDPQKGIQILDAEGNELWCPPLPSSRSTGTLQIEKASVFIRHNSGSERNIIADSSSLKGNAQYLVLNGSTTDKSLCLSVWDAEGSSLVDIFKMD